MSHFRYARVGYTIVRFSRLPIRDAWVNAGKKVGEERVAMAASEVPARLKAGRIDRDGVWTLIDGPDDK